MTDMKTTISKTIIAVAGLSCFWFCAGTLIAASVAVGLIMFWLNPGGLSLWPM